MSENSTQQKPLPTIWRTPDELWEIIEAILTEHDPPKSTARPRVDQRAALDAIIFRMRSGWQWNRLPNEFPEDSSVHRTFQRWIEKGVLDEIWEALRSRSARSWVAWTLNGRRRMERWARPVLGGPRRPQSHR
jgi:transposase